MGSVYLVALTGYARPADVARALAAGFDRHLAKPANAEALERIIEEATSVETTTGRSLH
jgi:CheY-like chemotaxis protein